MAVGWGRSWGLQVLRLNHPPAPPSPSALLHLPEFSKYSPSEADSCKEQTDYLSEGWDWQGGTLHSMFPTGCRPPNPCTWNWSEKTEANAAAHQSRYLASLS